MRTRLIAAALMLAVPLLLACPSCTGAPQSQQKQLLLPVCVDDKWGYMDNTCTLVVNPQFDLASHFSEGLAAVRIGDEQTGSWGYIDSTGKLVVGPRFDYACDFSGGLACVTNRGKSGYIDKTGKFVWGPA